MRMQACWIRPMETRRRMVSQGKETISRGKKALKMKRVEMRLFSWKQMARILKMW